MNAEIIKQYDAFKAGDITKDEWTLFMCDELENFIKSRMNSNHRLTSGEFEDMMQAGKMAVVANIDRYDPHKSAPTSFFVDHIDEFQRKACNYEGANTYTRNVLMQVEKVAKSLGVEADRVDLNYVSKVTKIGTKTLKKAMEHRKTRVSLEDLHNVSGAENPEKTYFRREESKYIQRIVEKCTPLEQFLLSMTIMGDNRLTLAKTVKLLKKDEYRVRFGEEIRGSKITENMLEQRISKVLRKLRNDPDFDRFIDRSEYRQELVEVF